jgi:NAD+ kinase
MEISKIAFVRRVERKETDDSAIKIFTERVLAKVAEHDVEAKIVIVDEFDHQAEREQLLEFKPDLICVLGGDGTFIRVVRETIELKTPYLGVNFGHRGFLLPFEAVDFQPYLHDLLSGKEPRFEERHALQAALKKKDGKDQTFVCVNDCAVKGYIKVVDLEVLVDGKGYLSCSGDGVLIATPSGSTAYNLAAGGSVMAPTERQLAITPICCYGSVERTIGDDRKVTIKVIEGTDAVFTPDGMLAIPMTKEDSVRVVAHPTTFRDIVPDNHEWYPYVQGKLGAVRV